MRTVHSDFPLLKNNPKLVYLDSASTSLKPQSVLDAMNDYYTHYGVNIHRGMYALSEKASIEYEETRQLVADFIHASSQAEIVFTRNTTESINLIAYTLGDEVLDRGDEIVTTILEHHSNFVPWQQLAQRKKAYVKVIDCDENGDLDIYNSRGRIDLQGVVTDKTWILAIQYISNVTGAIQPLKELIRAARKQNPNIIVVVDAAQAVAHVPIDVQDLDCDFLAFSAHKMYGPTGVGVLWGRSRFLDAMPPFLFGGDMVEEVAIEETNFQDSPSRFEAGTPDVAGVIGLKAAMRYIQSFGFKTIQKQDESLSALIINRLTQEFDGLNIIGLKSRNPRIALASFTLPNTHPHDLATLLDEKGIAVRAGRHCAMPLHTRLGYGASLRASSGVYTTEEDIETFVKDLKDAYVYLS